MSDIRCSTPSQHERFFTSHDMVSAGNTTMLDLLFGTNPISDDELRRLVEKRPNIYGKFAGYLGKRAIIGNGLDTLLNVQKTRKSESE